MEAFTFLSSLRRSQALMRLLGHRQTYLFEYFTVQDSMVIYNKDMTVWRKIERYLGGDQSIRQGQLRPEDSWQIRELLTGSLHGPMELRGIRTQGEETVYEVDAVPSEDEAARTIYLGYIRDITLEKAKEKSLRQQAQRDSLTLLYNNMTGKALIDQYLREKDPYASCGLLVIDVDFFKNVNDRYGHLFGDKVLQELAHLLQTLFSKKDILVRAGGDEFLVFLKDVDHATLLNKTRQLSESVRKIPFSENDYCLTCSIGACFLPENVSGYLYSQLFENADWALYQAKENGRNQYVFCDDLRRYTESTPHVAHLDADGPELDTRYLHNDLISTAFEIFEKTSRFEDAIDLFLKVVGIRLQLDRITILSTNIKERRHTKLFQWLAPKASSALADTVSFTKEDFLTLFQSYDENGIAVLQHDNLSMYSPAAQARLMQGGVKTAVYTAIYNEGEYQGAVAYIVCGSKRFWSTQSRRELGELTKIITAYLTRHLAANAIDGGRITAPDFDRLTGLLSFTRFREEVEHKIVGGYAEGYQIIYCDFENFKYFNEVYGYATGDKVLKEFSDLLVEAVKTKGESYLCRIVGDQFCLYLRHTPQGPDDSVACFSAAFGQAFSQRQALLYPEAHLRVRFGIYAVEPTCLSASSAIDKANFARKQILSDARELVRLYDKETAQRQALTNELMNGLIRAMEHHEFKLYLQPKFSLADLTVIGAEALVRWEKPDGTILYPDQFIPVLENSGRIVELDLYMLEQVAAFLERNAKAGRKLIPIAVNASVLLAKDLRNAETYSKILADHHINAALLEIELTETAAVSEFDCVKRLFACFQEKNMQTSLDDFGAGYSLLNSVVDIPINTVKLDRSFLTRCTTNQRGLYFLQEIVNMVKGLGYQVICEGIETKDQVDLMRSLGCDAAQGFWFSKAISTEAFEQKYMTD